MAAIQDPKFKGTRKKYTPPCPYTRTIHFFGEWKPSCAALFVRSGSKTRKGKWFALCAYADYLAAGSKLRLCLSVRGLWLTTQAARAGGWRKAKFNMEASDLRPSPIAANCHLMLAYKEVRWYLFWWARGRINSAPIVWSYGNTIIHFASITHLYLFTWACRLSAHIPRIHHMCA